MEVKNRLTSLVVDDEPLARAHLRRLLEQQGVSVLGEAEDATQALEQAEELSPAIVFLDIQMRGLTGMQAASAFLEMTNVPILVFVTGYSEYAVAAYERNALDYLVKPVAPDRLAKTLARARERLTDTRWRNQTKAIVTQQLATSPPLRRLPIRKNYAALLLRVEDILCAVSREKRVYVQTKECEYKTYYTLALLESLFPPDLFLRIHDSCIVNLEYVEELIFLGSQSYRVRLSNDLQLPVGRNHYSALQEKLGLNRSFSS